ncbi:hypothetical protein SEUCBS140593_002090 [Sporothrix eucalyptigena]|uniref:EVE domain-containing protein n=1 Tax=Sporothrix eucalyptigena TaxID=1812306 RepID=A0ABP0B3T1_9PEZI
MPPKRKAGTDAAPLRRSARSHGQAEPEPESQPAPAKRARTTAAKPAPKNTTPKKAAPKKPVAKRGRPSLKQEAKEPEEKPAKEEQPAAEEYAAPSAASFTTAVPASTVPAAAIPIEAEDSDRQYWLLKAEPESRFENGVDVRFSIDDLAACTEPEPWDGIRNYAARNNLRKMKRGDLAFFYHSNTKEPGIVGTMTIVQEHSPDLTAHDPKTAYYDPNAAADAAAGKEPKWSVVHVKFRSKFAKPITLRDLRSMSGPGQPLDSMQMLKQSRLSVSRVSAAEWKHLLGVAKAT